MRPLQSSAHILYFPSADEDFKGAAYILEHLQDPKTAFGENPSETPMMRAFGYCGDVWTWFEEPENTLRFKRFGAAMKGVSSVQPPHAILKGTHLPLVLGIFHL